MVQLKQLRTSRGLTQKQIAKLVKTTPGTIARWEAGKAEIPGDALKKLASVLHCMPDSILSTEPLKFYEYTPSDTFIDCLLEIEKKVLYGGLRFSFDSFDRVFNFPISGLNNDIVSHDVKSVGEISGDDWLIVETMDNWRLFINLKLITQIETYNFDLEEPPAYELPEVYEALTNTPDIEELELPDVLRSYCKEKSRQFERKHDYSLWDYYNHAIVVTRKGKQIEVFLDEETALEFSALEANYYDDGCIEFLKFVNEDSKSYQAVHAEHVAIAMVPSVAYHNYVKDEEEEKTEESEGKSDAIVSDETESTLESNSENECAG